MDIKWSPKGYYPGAPPNEADISDDPPPERPPSVEEILARNRRE